MILNSHGSASCCSLLFDLATLASQSQQFQTTHLRLLLPTAGRWFELRRSQATTNDKLLRCILAKQIMFAYAHQTLRRSSPWLRIGNLLARLFFSCFMLLLLKQQLLKHVVHGRVVQRRIRGGVGGGHFCSCFSKKKNLTLGWSKRNCDWRETRPRLSWSQEKNATLILRLLTLSRSPSLSHPLSYLTSSTKKKATLGETLFT